MQRLFVQVLTDELTLFVLYNSTFDKWRNLIFEHNMNLLSAALLDVFSFNVAIVSHSGQRFVLGSSK